MQARSYKNAVGLPLKILVSSLLLASQANADQLTNIPIPAGEGFYKDVLIDGGPGISASPARHFESLGLSYETLSYRAYDILTGEVDEEDRQAFVEKFIGSDIDLNGRLLYPDGAPRYRMLNIGAASFLRTPTKPSGGSVHARLLKGSTSPVLRTGAQNIQQFIQNGGGYTGFCAGAGLADDDASSLKLYPGQSLPLPDSSETVYLTDTIADALGYREVPNIMSLGGGYIFKSQSNQYPEGVEILGWTNQYPAVWSWRDPNNPHSGTLVLSGRHPELSHQEEAEELTKAMYALAIKGSLDGSYTPQVRIKGDLENGRTRYMDENTGHYDASHIKIGDKQYHHFKINVEDPRKKYLTIELNGEYGYDFNLYLKKGEPAFASNADVALTDAGNYKTLQIDNLTYGEWYVSVENATSVTADRSTNSEYSGQLDVLNGVAYDITATWDREPPCPTSISDVSAANPAFVGQKLPISWRAECFDAGSYASVDLVKASNEAKIKTITSSGGLNDGVNSLVWNATYNQVGEYKIRVSDNLNPGKKSLSPAFELKKPEMLIVPPVSSGEKLSVIWRWTGESSQVSLDLYQGNTLVTNLTPNYAQKSGTNSLVFAANWTWKPDATYKVRIRTRDRASNLTFFSPEFKPTLSSKVTVEGLDVNSAGVGEIMLDGCNPGKKCSRTLTFANQGGKNANLALQLLYVDEIVAKRSWGTYGLSSTCISNASNGQYAMQLPPGGACAVDLTYSWPKGISNARGGYLSMSSSDSEIELPSPGQKGVLLCADCR
ncbi:hypothetical protein HCH_01477 [Hahella chejuensis KCTC 2396]|uniref:Peptidase C-terminal archaeal/bacterial domain-containing protein n=1 Tax=Hahella chejuensis (strain KCTC 2396) TaxID=349521 RepID=Q2SLY9_HAHCH|nr:PPC domain-containing protein [Hahella chejuensis]ABC28335.1 hypothetical protein HCH_01477 [Hahella chejuensis KCTC 2396]